MQGPSFAQNLIGVEFDRDQWIALLRAGEPESAFMTRTVHQPVVPLRHPVPAFAGLDFA